MDFFESERDNLTTLAHEHHKETKRQKRDDDHLAALGKLGKQAAGSNNGRLHKQAGPDMQVSTT